METTDKPLTVSVFVVTYNQEKYIRQCLDSIVMQQTDFDYEIVIGEDCSTDGTRVVCEEFAKQYSQINLLPLTKNLGIASNWRRVLSNCKGKYVAMCEGDDYWCDPLKLQKQVDFLDRDIEEKYVLCFHNTMLVDECSNIISESKFGQDYLCDRTPFDLVLGKECSTQTVMFRGKYLSEVLTKMEHYNGLSNDSVLFALLAHYGMGKYLSNIEKSAYRIHNKGVWTSLPKMKHLPYAYETDTFKYKYQDMAKKELYARRLNYASKLCFNSIKNNALYDFVKYYSISSFLSLKKIDIKYWWNIQKGVVYNIIHK